MTTATADEATGQRRASPPGRARSGASEPRSEDAGAARHHLGIDYADVFHGTSDEVHERRRERFALLDVQRRAAPGGHRLAACLLRLRRAPAGSLPLARVTVFDDDRGGQQATVKGVARCGGQPCVVCGPKIAAGRAEQVNADVLAWLDAGGVVLHFGVTCSRRRGEDGIDQRRDLFDVWGRLFTGGQLRRLETAVGGRVLRGTGLEATVQVLEDGRTDLHPHLHGLLFVASGDGKRAFDAVFCHAVTGLPAGFAARGRSINVAEGGFHLQQVELRPDGTLGELGEYLTKGAGWGVGLELTAAHMKRGSGEKMTAAQLLAVFGETGDVAYRDAYRRYLAAVKGSSCYTRPKRFDAILALVAARGVGRGERVRQSDRRVGRRGRDRHGRGGTGGAAVCRRGTIGRRRPGARGRRARRRCRCGRVRCASVASRRVDPRPVAVDSECLPGCATGPTMRVRGGVAVPCRHPGASHDRTTRLGGRTQMSNRRAELRRARRAAARPQVEQADEMVVARFELSNGAEQVLDVPSSFLIWLDGAGLVARFVVEVLDPYHGDLLAIMEHMPPFILANDGPADYAAMVAASAAFHREHG